MLTYTLKKTPGHPLYEQLYQSIRDDIAAGRLPAGSRLPSKRVLAAHLGVSVVMVESAYAQLLAEGYAEARPRSGVYVCAIGSSVPVQPPHMPSLPQPSAPEPLFDLSGGTGRSILPERRSCALPLRPIWSRRAACASRRSRSSSARARSTFMASSCSSSGAGCAMPSRIPATAKFPASTRRTM